MPTLDVNNPNQVSSPAALDVVLGVSEGHLLIFTGIAIPEYDTNDDLIREPVTVNLGKTVLNPKIPFTYSATVGLASIGNSDSDFTFATDDVSVVADPNTGELQLVCDLAVQGSSQLHRFSYQANVIVQTTQPEISGVSSGGRVSLRPFHNSRITCSRCRPRFSFRRSLGHSVGPSRRSPTERCSILRRLLILDFCLTDCLFSSSSRIRLWLRLCTLSAIPWTARFRLLDLKLGLSVARPFQIPARSLWLRRISN